MPGLLQTPQRPMHGSGSSVNYGNLMQQKNQRQHSQIGRGASPLTVGADMHGSSPLGGELAANDGSRFFLDASVDLMLTDPALDQDIRARARALSAQTKQMTKLLQIGAALGEDVSGLMPIAQQLEQARQKVFKELIGRANVPTSASKPARPRMSAPKVSKPSM